MNVRPARLEDARPTAEVHVETWRATYPGVMPQELLDNLSVDEREALWRQRIPDVRTSQFVAEGGEADGLLGFVSVGPSFSQPGVGELYAIYVRPEAQGRGVGLALMDVGVGRLAATWDQAILLVATENPQARSFYERYGWTVDGERLDDSFPGAVVHETRYRLSGLKRR